MGKNLKNIIAAAFLGATSLVGCYTHPEYKFGGKIGDEIVIYEENRSADIRLGFHTYLTVIKPDGREINYIDSSSVSDLKLERVTISKEGNFLSYESEDVIGKPVVEEAQKQFDDYLQKIKEAKIKEGLDNLK